MTKKFTAKATSVINGASFAASELGHTYIGSEHLLMSMCAESDSVAAKLLERRGAAFDAVRAAVCARIGTGERTVLSSADMTPRTKRIIDASGDVAERSGQTYIGTEHILLSLLHETGCTAISILGSMGISAKELETDAASLREDIGGRQNHRSKAAAIEGCPTLMKYGHDLTAMARLGKLDPIIGREKETEKLIKILSRKNKNNPCLIGEPGVGKTAVVEGLAIAIAEQNVPETLAGKIILSLDLTSMVAGAKYRGEFEERMKSALDELKKNPSVIVFIDEIHNLTGTGAAEGAVDAANIMKPALARGEIKLIGATTISEYKKHIEKDAALERRFGVITVGEPTDSEAEAILFGLRDKYESHHKVKITDAAIKAAVAMSARYIGDRRLPDKALDLLDEAAVSAGLKGYSEPCELKNASEQLTMVRLDKEEAIRSQEYEKAASLRDREAALSENCRRLREEWQNARETIVPLVGEEDIAEAVTAATGIPRNDPECEERMRLSSLANTLKKEVIGQDEAANSLAKAIIRGRMGLCEPNRPTSSFIFLGPTGVGKTELCKVLANALFGSRDDLIRIDMSEFSESHSVSKLIGSPPGYVGYGEGGLLTEKVRRKPYSVVLLDEIEKAHTDIHHILLQILDDGRLTDSEGRVVNFKNTVIIMTSNIGAEMLTGTKKSAGFTEVAASDKKAAVMNSLSGSFSPEFLNRIDEIIIFEPLSVKDTAQICTIMLESVASRAQKLGVDFSLEEPAVNFIAEKGYDEKYGARPLRRTVRKYVEDPLSEILMNTEIPSEGLKLVGYLENDSVVFRQKN